MKKVVTLFLLISWGSIFLQAANSTAITSSYTQADSATIAYYASLINPDSIHSYMQSLQNFGTRFCLAPNRKQIAQWIMQKFISFGYADVILDSFPYNRTWNNIYYQTWQYNVVCQYDGYYAPDSIYILGAHHDSYVPPASNPFYVAPGADDNASGTAVTLEVARVMKTYGYVPAYTIRFITFAAEELGLHGSWYYANKAQATGMKIKGMINNDMVSYCTLPQNEWKVSIQKYPNSVSLTALANYIIQKFTILTAVESTQYINASDSYPFYIRGYKAIFFIEHQFTPHYHTVNDLVSSTNKYYAAEMTRISMGMLVYLNGSGYSSYPNYARWTGNGGTGWNDPSNWLNGIVPAGNTQVTIRASSGSYPVINVPVTINNLLIEPGATLTIEPGGQLTVAGWINNLAGQSGLILSVGNQGNTTIYPSLIHYSVDVPATIQIRF